MQKTVKSLIFIWLSLFIAIFGESPALGEGNLGGDIAVVSNVRVGVHGKETRVVLDIDRPVEFSIFTLPAPYRVVINLPEVKWGMPSGGAVANGALKNSLMSSYRYGLFTPGSSRMVIDAIGPLEVKKAFLLKPVNGSSVQHHRLVLDLVPTSETVFLESLAQRKSQAKASEADDNQVQNASIPMPIKKPKSNGKKIIMLDPGHGGVDPGTIGVSGTYEKNITLAMARDIKKAIEKSGNFQVKLTRDRDIFIRLRDRVTKARVAGADLFISIHADAIKNPKTRGLSVYTLSDKASDKEAAALARKENKADLIAGLDLSTENAEVTNILIDLAQRETMNQSAIVAQNLVKELKREVKLLRNTHRFAGFAVLKAPDLPSILVETGFLSNRQDERNLLNAKYRAKLAEAIAKGVKSHFAEIQEAQIH
ncbi:MAG: N-acetylmuramoyl-L-alanine amidase [Rhodospirillaceae bacterium]|nr:N-acetylmuramoyl-L-alanine amidase [Rhodospirillaceae bacterium]